MYKYFDVLFCLGRENAVQILLKFGANINDEDENKSTPLYWAAFQGNICLNSKCVSDPILISTTLFGVISGANEFRITISCIPFRSRESGRNIVKEWSQRKC